MRALNKLSGERVRALRNSRGLNQRELAEIAGLTPGAISQIELGVRGRRPGFDTLQELARALSVPIEELLQTEEGA